MIAMIMMMKMDNSYLKTYWLISVIYRTQTLKLKRKDRRILKMMKRRMKKEIHLTIWIRRKSSSHSDKSRISLRELKTKILNSNTIMPPQLKMKLKGFHILQIHNQQLAYKIKVPLNWEPKWVIDLGKLTWLIPTLFLSKKDQVPLEPIIWVEKQWKDSVVCLLLREILHKIIISHMDNLSIQEW